MFDAHIRIMSTTTHKNCMLDKADLIPINLNVAPNQKHKSRQHNEV